MTGHVLIGDGAFEVGGIKTYGRCSHDRHTDPAVSAHARTTEAVNPVPLSVVRSGVSTPSSPLRDMET